MNPRRLHSDTIFSISGISFGSAIRTGSVWHGPHDVKVTATPKHSSPALGRGRAAPPRGRIIFANFQLQILVGCLV